MTAQKPLSLAAGAAAFALVAILNSGGYRYGVGDQAFYVPAVAMRLDPTLFPRDRHMLHAQDRLTLYDEVTAAAAHATGASLPMLFFAAYIGGLALIFGAAIVIGRIMYESWWTVATLAALLTLRHRITQTGANSLEPYFHPRMLAFAAGAWAIAAYLRGRRSMAVVIVGAAFAIHPTTGLWFAVFIGAALFATEPAWRVSIGTAAACAGAAAAWALLAGPLRGRFGVMDDVWASAMAGKDYIFPEDWGTSFWLVNLGYLPVSAAIFWVRRRRGAGVDREAGLLSGAIALGALFLASLPLLFSHVTLALQLQISRVFWLHDFVAALFLAWLLTETSRSAVVRRLVAVIVIGVAVTRGAFVWGAEHAGRPIAQLGLPDDDWTDAMRWVARTPPDTYVLADPGHAWKYGTSVRVAGRRDVYLEEVKDLAMALYSRDVAVDALERMAASKGFEHLAPLEFVSLARRYELDYLVIDRDLKLPLAYENAQFRIYALQGSHTP